MNWSLQNTSSWFMKQGLFFDSNDTTFQPWMLPMLVWMCLLISTWCCAHQMDVVVQKAITFFCSKNFVSSIMGITGHLCCQVNHMSEKQYKCPWFFNTCWLSMEQFLSWLILNRPHLTQHFDEKRPSYSPTKSFWILAHVLKGFVLTEFNTSSYTRPVHPFEQAQKMSRTACEHSERRLHCKWLRSIYWCTGACSVWVFSRSLRGCRDTH